MILHAHPISAEAFAPFGQLLTSRSGLETPVNENRAVRVDTGAALLHSTKATQPSLAIYRISASQWPVQVTMLERHRHSSQLFLPMSGQTFLIVVALSTSRDEPDLTTLTAFTGSNGQGILYAPAIWHHPLVSVDEPGEFGMLMWEMHSAEDCEVHRLAEPISIEPVHYAGAQA